MWSSSAARSSGSRSTAATRPCSSTSPTSSPAAASRGCSRSPSPPTTSDSGLLYINYTDTDRRLADGRVPALGRRPGDRRSRQRPGAAAHRRLRPQPQRRPAACSVPTASSTSGWATAAAPGDPERTAQDPDSPLGKLLRIDPDKPGDYEVAALGLRNPWRFSFDPRRPASSGSATSARTRSRRSTRSPRERRSAGAQLRLVGVRGHQPLQRRPGGARRDRPPVLEYGRRRRLLGHRRLRRARPGARSRSTAATCTATTASASCTASPPTPASTATDDRPLGLQVAPLSSFGEDAAGHVYAISLDGPVYRLAPDRVSCGRRRYA